MRPILQFCKLIYLWHDAGGRDRDAIRHDKQAVLVRHYIESRDQIFKIQKRLAGAHADQICPVRRLALDAVDVVEDNNHLLHDLAGGQVAQKAELCRQAKIAFQRTARLRRKTDRIAIFAWDKDGLDRKAVRGFHQITPCAVGRNISRFDDESRYISRLFEFGAQLFWQIGDLIEPAQTTLVHSLKNLRRAVSRLAK